MTGLEALSRGYLGQEWELFGPTPDACVAAFAAEEPEEVPGAIAGLEDLRVAELSEQQFHDRWILELHSGYDPRGDGYTFREWFAHALEILRAEAARRGQ